MEHNVVVVEPTCLRRPKTRFRYYTSHGAATAEDWWGLLWSNQNFEVHMPRSPSRRPYLKWRPALFQRKGVVNEDLSTSSTIYLGAHMYISRCSSTTIAARGTCRTYIKCLDLNTWYLAVLKPFHHATQSIRILL